MEVLSGTCEVWWHMVAYDPMPYIASNAQRWGTPVERALDRIWNEHERITEFYCNFHVEAAIRFEYECIEDLVAYHKKDKTWVRKKFKEYLAEEHLHENELIKDWIMKEEAEEFDFLIEQALA